MNKIKTMAITCGIFTVTFLLFGVVARAADLGGMKDQTVYDSPAPVTGWTGGYVGGQIGYGWNSHDLSVSHAETTPGTSASCKEGASMGDNGKCYVSVDVPAIPASCKDGYGMKEDGACYAVTQPAEPERCRTDRWGNDYSLISGKCYKIEARDSEGDPTELSGNDNPLVHENAKEAVLGDESVASALNPAQEASTKLEEKPDAYVGAIDASSTIYNVARSIDTGNLIGGVTVGFDYQAGSAVVGLFGQYNLSDSSTYNSEFDVTVVDGNSWLVGARAGGLITPRTLAYGLVGYGWQEVAYKGGDEKLEKTFGHLVAGGGLEFKVAKHVTLGVEGQHWFVEKKTLFEDGGDKVVDERSDTRVLASVKYRFGDE